MYPRGFQGQRQQQSAITPPVSSKGCLAPGSPICDCVPRCVPVPPPPTTHTLSHREALQLVTGYFSQSTASLFNTWLSIQLLSSLISSLASKLRYTVFKNRLAAEFTPWEGRISHCLGGESKASALLHIAILMFVRCLPWSFSDICRRKKRIKI